MTKSATVRRGLWRFFVGISFNNGLTVILEFLQWQANKFQKAKKLYYIL